MAEHNFLSESGPAVLNPEPYFSRGFDTGSLLSVDGRDLPVPTRKDSTHNTLAPKTKTPSREKVIGKEASLKSSKEREKQLQRDGREGQKKASLADARGSGTKATSRESSEEEQRREPPPTPPITPARPLENILQLYRECDDDTRSKANVLAPLGTDSLPPGPLALVTELKLESQQNLASDILFVDILGKDTTAQALKRGDLTNAEVVDFFRDDIFPKPSRIRTDTSHYGTVFTRRLGLGTIKCGLQRRMDKDTIPAATEASTGRRHTPVPDITFGYDRASAFSEAEQAKLRELTHGADIVDQPYGPVLPFFTVHFQSQSMGADYVESHKPLLSTACCSNAVVMMNSKLAAKAADPYLDWTPDAGKNIAMESISFGAAISRHQLNVYITWQHDHEHQQSDKSDTQQPLFCTRRIATYNTRDEWGLARFRRWADTIVGWGSGFRLARIRSVLNILPLACCPLPPSLFSPSSYGLEVNYGRMPKPARVDGLIQRIKFTPGSSSEVTTASRSNNPFLSNKETIFSDKERKQLKNFRTGATKSELEGWFRDRILPVKKLPDVLETSERVPMNSKSFPLPVASGLDADAAEPLCQPPDQASMPAPDLIYGYDPAEAFPRSRHQNLLLDEWHEDRKALSRRNTGFLFPFFSVRFVDNEEEEAQAREDCLVASAICVSLVDSLNRRCARVGTAGSTDPKPSMVLDVNSAVYSLVVSCKMVELFVTWKANDEQGQGQGQSNTRYRMASIMKVPVATLDVWVVFRMTVNNILKWGATYRLDCIQGALDAICRARGAEEDEQDAKPAIIPISLHIPPKEKLNVDRKQRKRTAPVCGPDDDESSMKQIRLSIEN